MYEISKRLEIAGSHCLKLPYDSPCQRLHGHNWIVTVHVRGRTLNPSTGMLLDFKEIKEMVKGKYDHQNLCEVAPFKGGMNPTAENMARVICDAINQHIRTSPVFTSEEWGTGRPQCFRVEVQESEGNVACFTV